jgi:two-component system cell cycle sensor histidine kinase/response regulator CckA
MSTAHPTYDDLARRCQEAEALVARLQAAEVREAHVKRVLLAIRNVNQLIVQERDQQRLIERVCVNLTETLGYFHAWIALQDPATGAVTVTAESGLGDKFIALRAQLLRGEFPQCMHQTLTRTPSAIHICTMMTCRECPLVTPTVDCAGLTCLLTCDDTVYGVLAVSVPIDYAQDAEEQRFFTEVAGDLAFALHNIAREHQQLAVAAALRQSEEKFAKAFRISPDSVNINRLSDGVYLDINDGFTQITGYTREDVIGRSSLPGDLGIWVDAADRQRLLEALRAHGECIGLEARFRGKDGGERIGLMSARLLEIGGERCILSVTRDITARKAAEEALRESEQRYREIFNATSEAIFIDDAHTGQILDMNDTMLKLYGYASREDVLTGTIGDLSAPVPPFTEAEAQRRVQAAVAGEPQQFEWLAKKRTGELFPVEVTLRHSRIGGLERVLAVVRDISERKRAEDEQAQLQAQLLQAQKMESIGRLAGGIAHDFNNMLGVILGHAELAAMAVSADHPVHADLDEIQKAATRSADLTRQLLAFARKQTVVPTVLHLNEAIDGMLNMLRRLIGEDIDLAWLPGLPLAPVFIDPSQLDQILVNLCINARDAISGVGRVTLETCNVLCDEAYCANHAGCHPGAYVLLTVSDDGCGMTDDIKGHLFEPFFTTKGVGQGSGLGLATVYGIVQQNHGFIHVYSEPGQGTTLRIYLPRHAGEAALSRPVADLPPLVHGGETVLLVEDEPGILHMGRQMLTHLGYQVLTADTPSAALRVAAAHAGPLHLLVTDVVMPEMNGRDLARQMHTLYPHLKCLYMSGYTANVIAHHGVLDDHIHFLQKPFSLPDLACKVREALDRDE